VNYTFPQYGKAKNDNVLCRGQSVQVARGHYSSMCVLASSQSGMATGNILVHYTDGVHPSPVLAPPWWSWPYPAGGDIVFPYFLTNSNINYNRSSIFQFCKWLDSKKELSALTLPNIGKGAEAGPYGTPVGTRLHIFSLTLNPASAVPSNGPILQVKHARSTQKWIEGSNNTQIIEAVITNVGNEFVSRNHSVSISVSSTGLQTVKKATIRRLAPGDQVEVEIGVMKAGGFTEGQSGLTSIVIDGVGVGSTNYTFQADYSMKRYRATHESIYAHESPNWFNNAKFGIFIHWGVYAVPAWGSTGKNETYAEWCVSCEI
jgi:alpha-L-fucosidase